MEKFLKKTRALRAHTPCVFHLHHFATQPVPWTFSTLLMTFTYLCKVSRAHEHMHIIIHHALCIMHAWAWSMGVAMMTGQHKCTIFDTCRPYHSILSVLKPVFRRIRQICFVYNLPRCLVLQIWRFLCPRQRHNQLLYPCACVQGKYPAIQYSCSVLPRPFQYSSPPNTFDNINSLMW